MGVDSSIFQFSIYKRSDSKNWQVQFRDASNHLIQRGTGTPNKLKAYQIAADWQANGLPTLEPSISRPLADVFNVEAIIDAIRKAQMTPEEARKIVDILKERGLVQVSVVQKGQGDVDFIVFLEKFWDFDRSEYIKDKLAHGQRFGRARAYDLTCRLKLHWEPFFAGRTLSSITKADLRSFSAEIAKKGLASSTVNHTIEVGTIALAWAKENDLIPIDPSEGLRRFSGTPVKRGVLEPDEVAALFAEPWDDERSYVGNLIAATTGLRAGEILALRVDNIGRDRIHVRHSWSPKDHLKSTKTGEERVVPLLTEVKAALLALASKNPWGPSGFIFYSAKPDVPMDIKRLLDPLIEQFIRMKAGTEANQKGAEEGRVEALAEWRSRNLTFHGWRHFYSARMADLIDARKIMLATGHKTQSVFNAYADHSRAGDFDEVGQAAKLAFGKVIAMPERTCSKVG